MPTLFSKRTPKMKSSLRLAMPWFAFGIHQVCPDWCFDEAYSINPLRCLLDYIEYVLKGSIYWRPAKIYPINLRSLWSGYRLPWWRSLQRNPHHWWKYMMQHGRKTTRTAAHPSMTSPTIFHRIEVLQQSTKSNCQAVDKWRKTACMQNNWCVVSNENCIHLKMWVPIRKEPHHLLTVTKQCFGEFTCHNRKRNTHVRLKAKLARRLSEKECRDGNQYAKDRWDATVWNDFRGGHHRVNIVQFVARKMCGHPAWQQGANRRFLTLPFFHRKLTVKYAWEELLVLRSVNHLIGRVLGNTQITRMRAVT